MYTKIKELMINAGIQVDPDTSKPLTHQERVEVTHFLHFKGKKVEDFIGAKTTPVSEEAPVQAPAPVVEPAPVQEPVQEPAPVIEEPTPEPTEEQSIEEVKEEGAE